MISNKYFFIKDNTEEGKREIEEWKKRYLDPSENRWVANLKERKLIA